jgi:hypothetical protein
MIETIKRKQDIKFVVWNNNDETLESIRKEFLIKLNTYDDLKISVGDAMFISTKYLSEGSTTNSYHEVGDYIVLDSNPLNKWGCPEEEWFIRGYDKETFIKHYGKLL